MSDFSVNSSIPCLWPNQRALGVIAQTLHHHRVIPGPAENAGARIPCADDLHRRRHQRAVLALERDDAGVLIDLPRRGLELQLLRKPTLAIEQIDPALGIEAIDIDLLAAPRRQLTRDCARGSAAFPRMLGAWF
ncbi:MAG: hypothetical protein IPL62_13110 [Caulobacteraceae bacterium]|nr:hypothetical protein [Caulobacteraceae bacterium]